MEFQGNKFLYKKDMTSRLLMAQYGATTKRTKRFMGWKANSVYGHVKEPF